MLSRGDLDLSVELARVTKFMGLTFAFSWGLVGIYLGLGGSWSAPGSTVVSVAYMFCPMIAALIVQRTIPGERAASALGVVLRPNRWFVAAWLIPPAIAIATLGVGLLLPGAEFAPEMEGMYERFASLLSAEEVELMRQQASDLPVHPFWIALVQGLIAGLTVNAVAGLGEELGWRGFLQRELAGMSFWRMSLAIGLVWGVWHAPLILLGHNYPDHPVAGTAMMVVFTILFSPIIGWVRIRAGSVVAAAIMHGTLNGTGGLAILVIVGGSDLTIGVTGVAGLIVLAAIDLGIYLLADTEARETHPRGGERSASQ